MPARILIVDDEEGSRTVMAELLREHGYSVIHAIDGVQAISRARLARPDAILMDVGMPAMDGVSAAVVLRTSDPTAGIPIIACTAMSALPDQLRRPFDEVIEKPVEIEQVIAALRRQIGSSD